MSLIAFSPTVSESGHELEPLERLSAQLSSRFARMHATEISSALAEALAQVAGAVNADGCALAEFTEDHVRIVRAWPDGGTTQNCVPSWLLDRFERHEIVEVSQIDDLPPGEREQAARRGGWSGLSVPVVAANEQVCALLVWSRITPRRFPAGVVERIQFIAEILGLAVHRCRHESALRACQETIERLNVRLVAVNAHLRDEIEGHHDVDNIIGESAALRRALARLVQVAPVNSTVLLLGETGTGKELFARALHDRSRRRTRAFVRVNCAALPPTLIESELFGHEKGAFTGAVSARQGRFELADRGTIFLDEIGDLAPDIQVKLLRVLQEGEFERVGASRTKRVDVRVIAATNRDLDADVAAGRFRADLYYRLSVYPITVPPLRERLEDIPALVWFFIHRRQRELGRRITAVPQAAMQALQRHAWPGNVRELENVVERALIHSKGETLLLDETVGYGMPQSREEAAPAGSTLDAFQRRYIETVLRECGWRINGRNNAAERLGLHPNTLRFRMHKLGLLRPEDPNGQASCLIAAAGSGG